MADKAYGYMDWAAIEGLVYSEEAHPRRILAPRKVSEGILYQCYLPGAAKVRLHDLTSGQTHHMAMEDETGYFACVVPGKAPAPHVSAERWALIPQRRRDSGASVSRCGLRERFASA